MLEQGDAKPRGAHGVRLEHVQRARARLLQELRRSVAPGRAPEVGTKMRSWSYVKVRVWFNLENTSTGLGDRVDNYGLLAYDGSEKPAYGAFQRAATLL